MSNNRPSLDWVKRIMELVPGDHLQLFNLLRKQRHTLHAECPTALLFTVQVQDLWLFCGISDVIAEVPMILATPDREQAEHTFHALLLMCMVDIDPDTWTALPDDAQKGLEMAQAIRQIVRAPSPSS